MTTTSFTTFAERLASWPESADGPRLVLFDIDRTLLDTCGGNKRAMSRAGCSVFGDLFDLEGIDRSGQLDCLILTEALAKLGEQLTNDHLESFRTAYAEELASELSGQVAMPGALAWVNRLSQIHHVILGLVTGNFASAAAVKLPAIGLDFDAFVANGFGDHGERRADLVSRARAACPQAADEQTLIIGDTPRDVACARDNGCLCLCVATGDYTPAQLRDAGAPFVVDDLTRPEATDFIQGFLSGRVGAV